MIPRLETLEARISPAGISFHGGPVLSNAVVDSLYVSGAPFQMDAYTAALPAAYSGILAQYGASLAGFGRSAGTGPMGGVVSDYNPGSITQLQQRIIDAIQAGLLPSPDGRQLYVVYLAPGQSIVAPWAQNSDGNFAGYHSAFWFANQWVPYAVVVAQGGQVNTGLVTSHEAAEGVTDPVPGTGWFGSSTEDEIADRFAWQWFASGGYPVTILTGKDGTPLVGPGLSKDAAIAEIPNQEIAFLFWDVCNLVAPQFRPWLTPRVNAAQDTLLANPMEPTPAGQTAAQQGAMTFGLILANVA